MRGVKVRKAGKGYKGIDVPVSCSLSGYFEAMKN